MRTVFTGILLASVGATACYAQSADGQTILLNTIVVENDEGGDLRVNVTSDDLARTKPTDLQDVFVSEPTIEVGSPLPASQKLYVNGVEETNLTVTIDGGRQNNKIFHHNATTLIDPTLLKAVAINPGVAPADAGPGALAGSVEYETKDARDLLAEGQTLGGFISSSYETEGNIFTTSASAYGRAKGFEVLGFVRYADGGRREDGSGVDIIGSKTQMLSGLGKVAYQADSGDRFELSLERVRDDAQRPFRADIGRVLVGRPVPDEQRYDITRYNAVFTYTDETPDGWWDPKLVLAYSATELDVISDDFDNFGKTDSFNGKFENRFGFELGSVTAGVDFYRDKGRLEFESRPDPTVDFDKTSERATNVGAYAQARLDVTDELYVSFGGRGDVQQIRGVSGFKETNSGFSVNGSFQYRLNDYFTVGAGAARSFGGIQLAEPFIQSSAWVYTGAIKPVDATSFYVAARAEYEQFYLDGKLFKTNIDDARTPSFGGGPAAAFTDLEARGFEIGAGIFWNGGFARVGYANVDTEINGVAADSFSGRYLTTPIGQIITVEAAHTLPSYGVTFGADARIALQNNNTFNFGDPTNPLEAFQVFNAFVEYEPEEIPGLALRLEANNIFDETYAARGTYGQDFAGQVEPLNEPGRSFIMSATFTF